VDFDLMAVRLRVGDWDSGVLEVGVRLRTPNGLRRLGLTHRPVVSPAGMPVVPSMSEVPLRILLPSGSLLVNGVEYRFPGDQPAGTVVRLTVDFDLMAVRLSVGDWDSGVLDVVPAFRPEPLFPYFLMDSGDSFEVVP